MRRYCKTWEKVPRSIERILKCTGYKIRVKREGGFKCPWDKKYPFDHFRYRVSITAPGGNSTWFYFWGSNADYWESCKYMPGSGKGLSVGAMIGSWIRDAEYGEVSFQEFCNDIDGNMDSIANLKMHNSCIRNRQKVERLFPERILRVLQDCAWEM